MDDDDGWYRSDIALGWVFLALLNCILLIASLGIDRSKRGGWGWGWGWGR